MTFIIRCQGVASRVGPDPTRGPVNQFLKQYEVMSGLSDWTFDPNEAMKFRTMTLAIQMWRAILPTDPVRADGKPNRPLTAFTVEFVPLEDALAEQRRRK